MNEFQKSQAAKILNCYSDDLEKGRKPVPVGTKSKDGKTIKTANGWKPVKKEDNSDEVKIITSENSVPNRLYSGKDKIPLKDLEVDSVSFNNKTTYHLQPKKEGNWAFGGNYIDVSNTKLGKKYGVDKMKLHDYDMSLEKDVPGRDNNKETTNTEESSKRKKMGEYSDLTNTELTSAIEDIVNFKRGGIIEENSIVEKLLQEAEEKYSPSEMSFVEKEVFKEGAMRWLNSQK